MGSPGSNIGSLLLEKSNAHTNHGLRHLSEQGRKELANAMPTFLLSATRKKQPDFSTNVQSDGEGFLY
jgi:hypothetical protein